MGQIHYRGSSIIDNGYPIVLRGGMDRGTPGETRGAECEAATRCNAPCCSTGSSPAKVVSMNPAAAVRGPKHVVNEGKMPVLDGPEWGGA